MSVSLGKGGRVSLSKEEPGLSKVMVGLGWTERTTGGVEFDLDASAVGCDSRQRAVNDQFFVFYNNLTSPDGAIASAGDDRAGGTGEDDNETITIDLTRLDPRVESIPVIVSIYDADRRGQNFGQVRRAYIRIVNEESGREIARYDLAEDLSAETAAVFGTVYKRDGEWRFTAVGQGYSNGLAGVIADFGIQGE